MRLKAPGLFKSLTILCLLIIVTWVIFIFLQVSNYRSIKKHEFEHGKTVVSIIRDYLEISFYGRNTIEEIIFDNLYLFLKAVSRSGFDNELIEDYRIQSFFIWDNESEIFTFSYPENLEVYLDVNYFSTLNETVLFDYEDPDNPWYYMVSPLGQLTLIAGLRKDYLYDIIRPFFISTIFYRVDEFMSEVFDDNRSHFVYVALQDTLGIIAATENVDSLDRISSSDFLTKALEKSRILVRVYDWDEKNVIETVAPFDVGSNNSILLRFAMSSELLQESLRSFYFYITIYTFVLLLLFFFISDSPHPKFSFFEKIEKVRNFERS